MTSVVFVHGLRGSGLMWRAQQRALSRAGVASVAVDLPGHGRFAGQPFTLAGCRSVIDDAVTAAAEPVLLVGLSLGGYEVIRYAAEHPGRVAGVMASSCCTVPYPVLVDGMRLVSAAIARLPDAGARLSDVGARALLPPEGYRDLADGGFAADVMLSALAQMRGRDPLADLATIDAPVWLVNGTLDHFRGQERRFLAACRDGRLILVPGATHLVNLVAPVAYDRVLLSVLDELDGSSSSAVVA